jgi:hypothetical protein
MKAKRESQPDVDPEADHLVSSPSDIPEFASLAEEHEFWRTRRFSSHFWRTSSGTVPPELRVPKDLSRLSPGERNVHDGDAERAMPLSAASGNGNRQRRASNAK